MVRGIDRGLRRVNVLDAFDIDANEAGCENHARPMNRKPVLHTAIVVDKRRQQRQAAHNRGVKVNQRHEDEIRTQAAEQAAFRFSLFALS